MKKVAEIIIDNKLTHFLMQLSVTWTIGASYYIMRYRSGPQNLATSPVITVLFYYVEQKGIVRNLIKMTNYILNSKRKGFYYHCNYILSQTFTSVSY